MANNALELSIKIAGKIDNSFTSAIATAQKQTSTFAKALSSVGKAGLAIEGALLTGTLTALKKCTNYAEEFQVQMADVAKYVNGLTDSNGKTTNAVWSEAEGGNGKTYQENYDAMASQLFKLSTQYSLTPEELAVMASNLGQSGYSAEDIAKTDANGNVTGVLKDTATMAAAFDIGTDQAGEWMAKWENAFGMSHDEILTLTDQINYLGNTSATTAAEIAESVNRAGSLGQIAGVSTSTTAALATAMLQAGGDSATVGTSLNRIFVNLTKGSSATETQERGFSNIGMDPETVAKQISMGGSTATETLKQVFSAIGKLDKDKQTSTISDLFGQWAIGDAARVVGNMDAFVEALDKVSDDNYDNWHGSMEAEANVKNSTTAATGEMLESAKKWLEWEIGQEFLPVQSQFNQIMIGIYTSLAENMPEISAIAGSFATILSDLVTRLGTALEDALPYLQQALDWLASNPETALTGLGAITGAFATMAAAPKIESAGKLLFGGSTGSSTGLLGLLTGGSDKGTSKGILSTLFSGGQSAAKGLASAPGNILSSVSGWWAASKGLANDTTGKSGLLSTLGVGIKSLLPSGLLDYGNSISNSVSALGKTKIGGALSNGFTGLLNLMGGEDGTIAGAMPSLRKDLANAAKSQLSVLKYSKVGQFATGAAGKVSGGLSLVANSAPAKAITSGLGALPQFLGAGANVLGTVASPFLSLFTGIAPIIGIIGTLIGLFVVFQNHLGDVQNLIGSTFGPEALTVFNTLYAKVQGVFEGIGNFINGGWLDAFNNAKNFITQTFGANIGNAFGALQPALEAVFNFIQQIVAFGQSTVAPIIEQIGGFVVGTVGPQLLQLFTTLAPLLGTIGNLLGGMIMTGMNLIGNVLGQIIIPAVEAIITGVLNFANAVAPTVVSVIEGIVASVTGVVNGIISAINWIIEKIDTLSFDIPEWVPLVGGNHIGFNFTPLPLLANGGFTNGPSIAGEAGTEAVISFKSSQRAANLANWARAGEMLGAGAELKQFEDNDDPFAGGGTRGSGDGITFAPVFQFYGDVTEEQAKQAGQISFAEFKRLYQKMKREEARTSFAW